MGTWPVGITIVLATLFSLPPEYSSEQNDARIEKAARELFDATLVKKQVREARRCLFKSTWGQAVIPEEIATKYLKLNVHGGVIGSPPGNLEDVQEVFDPNGENKSAFCDDDDRQKIAKEAIERFDSGAIDHYDVEVLIYGFPVFSENFDTAIYTTESYGGGRNFIGLDRRKNSYNRAHCSYHVMKKENGTWHEKDDVEFCIS